MRLQPGSTRVAGALLFVLALVATIVLPIQPVSAAPADQAAAQRAAAVVRAAGFVPNRVPDLVEVSTQIETWILEIEAEADRRLATVEAADARMRTSRLALIALEIQVSLAREAIESGELTRAVVQLRNQMPTLEVELAEAQREADRDAERATAVRVTHAKSIEALMIAWNLRQEVGTSFANFAQEPGVPTPTDGWTPLLTQWAMDLFRDAMILVDALDEPSQPASAVTSDLQDMINQTGAYSPIEGDSDDIRWPAIGAVNSGFGMRVHPVWGGYRMHTGMDIDADYNDEVLAMDAGVVVRSGWNGGYGNTVELDHGDGLTSLYAHLSTIDVELGDEVELGQSVGLVGATGTATDAHLHFEVRVDGSSVDPLLYLP